MREHGIDAGLPWRSCPTRTDPWAVTPPQTRRRPILRRTAKPSMWRCMCPLSRAQLRRARSPVPSGSGARSGVAVADVNYSDQTRSQLRGQYRAPSSPTLPYPQSLLSGWCSLLVEDGVAEPDAPITDIDTGPSDQFFDPAQPLTAALATERAPVRAVHPLRPRKATLEHVHERRPLTSTRLVVARGGERRYSGRPARMAIQPF